MGIRKSRAGAFFGTPLASHLIRPCIDGVVLCGETTSGCLSASAVDDYSHVFTWVEI